MERQMQEHSGKKQQFVTAENRTKSSARKQSPMAPLDEKQKDKGADDSMDTLSQPMAEKDQTRVAELAYVLYEQCGREDGHDMEHWLEAERRFLARTSTR